MNTFDTDNLARLSKLQPRVIQASEHRMPVHGISRNALTVLRRLRAARFQAYLVGGCVRDLLLDLHPKDFDVATDAHPEQVRELFRNCILIGRRFRLAHVRFGPEIIEISTFRAPHRQGEDGMVRKGRIIRDNVYGNMTDDAWRRDFTINALFYDAAENVLVDYNEGWEDLRRRRLRLIGEPRQRYLEDPVRMLRAIRFAAKLDFEIAPASAAPITQLAQYLGEIPSARLFDEFSKLFLSGYAVRVWELLSAHQLAERLFSGINAGPCAAPEDANTRLPRMAMEDTDQRIAARLPVTPAFLIAALLWPELRGETARLERKGRATEAERADLAADTVLSRQVKQLAIPRRFSIMVREIWQLQHALQRHAGGARRHVDALCRKKRIRAAYDFLLLRMRAGEPVQQAADWWTALQEREPHAFPGKARAPDDAREAHAPPRHRKRRRRRTHR